MRERAARNDPASAGESSSPLERHYPEVRFGGFTSVDSTVAFYTRVRALIEDAGTVLDIGCGRGAQVDDPVAFRRDLRDFRRPGRTVIGLDRDARARANPCMDDVRLIGDDARWPVESSSADACICDFVLEHVDDPEAFFSECRRVLRPDGVVCIRTTNARSYVGVASRLTPLRLHTKAVELLQAERPSADVFPTFYRCNTRRSLSRALSSHGFDDVVQAFDPEPAYLDRWPILYRLGVWHQRFAPRAFGVTLLAFGRKHGR